MIALMNISSKKSEKVAQQLGAFIKESFPTKEFRWQLQIKDWTGKSYSIGQKESHRINGKKPLIMTIKTPAAAKELMTYNAMGLLDKFVSGEVDIEGNLYLFSEIRPTYEFNLKFFQRILALLKNKAFQKINNSTLNVKSHYDIPQEALNVYLDQRYMSYSCGMFERPYDYNIEEMLKVGKGEKDKYDSLEKAQWRKFKDAVDFLNPKKGDTMLDVGCGYGGQLEVALESHPFGKVVGWTHSANQAKEGKKLLQKYPKKKWDLIEGDYRQDNRVFDHITSTGMISHVGPRGLTPYVRNIRRRIKTGGHYVHHALMIPAHQEPMDQKPGIAFNKKYVWPGFHWFTYGNHAKVLEDNGFEIKKSVNLFAHYAKTSASWYERMMQQKDLMIEKMGEPTFRAWQVFLAGATGCYIKKKIHVYRIYCEAVEPSFYKNSSKFN